MNFKKNWKRFFSLSRRHDGFTLVELIVVIAILAILAGVAVPAYSGYIEKANQAGDQQLLATVNTAFAAAVTEKAGGIGNINSATLTYGGTEGAITVTGIASINGAANVEISTAFGTYYAGNEDATFKTAATLKYNTNTHLFEIYPTSTQQAAVDAFNKSNLAGKTTELTLSVDNLAGMLADRIAQDGAAGLLQRHMDALGEGEYEAFMAKYGLTEDSSDAEIANATVMYVADKLSGNTAEDIRTVMNGNPQNIITEYGTIPTAAMMYGLMTGYANSSYGENYTQKAPTGVSEVLGEFMNLYQNDSNFQAYFNSSEKGGMADMDGFLAAMDVVNNYEGSFDLSDENLFVSDETNALLDSILGANS